MDESIASCGVSVKNYAQKIRISAWKLKTKPVTTGTYATATVYCTSVLYVWLLCAIVGSRNQTLHPLQPWQGRFLCRDSNYFWDSLGLNPGIFLNTGRCKYSVHGPIFLNYQTLLKLWSLVQYVCALVLLWSNRFLPLILRNLKVG